MHLALGKLSFVLSGIVAHFDLKVDDLPSQLLNLFVLGHLLQIHGKICLLSLNFGLILPQIIYLPLIVGNKLLFLGLKLLDLSRLLGNKLVCLLFL